MTLRPLLAAALAAFAVPSLAAPLLHVYGGVRSEVVTPRGDAGSGNYGADLHDELGYSRTHQNTFYIGLEHALPLWPNVRLTQSHFNDAPTFRLTPGAHGGATRPGMTMASRLDITNTDLTLYYSPLKGPVKLDVGFDLRRIEVEFALQVTPDGAPRPIQSFDKRESQVFPAVFAATHIDLPLANTYLTAEALYSRYQDRRQELAVVGLGWAPLPLVEVGLGYRHERQKFSSDNFRVDMTTRGPYLGVSLHF